MHRVTMTAFILHYWKNARLDLLGLLACAFLLCSYSNAARAEPIAAEISRLQFERVGDAVLLSATVNFELSTAVEDALLKGVAIIFVAEADVLRERWYWTNRKVVSTARHMRLTYQPLTRRWRLNVASGTITNARMALALNQNFESLPDALAAVQRLYRWKIAELAELEPDQRYLVDFRFRLDTSQLPRPFQIGTLFESEWNISASARQPLVWETDK